MRKIVYSLSVSLDGFMEAPAATSPGAGWTTRCTATSTSGSGRWAASSRAGSPTSLWPGFWPTADRQPDVTEPMREFAAIWCEMPKIVYSRTLGHADWNTTIVRDVVPDEVRALKARAGGDLVVGGADLAATFREHDLIDEYRVYVQPVLLGAGTPMFGEAEAPTDLRLLETRTFGNGVVLLRYERA